MEQGNHKGYSENIPERQLAALKLRQAGMTYRDIGERLEVSHVTAYNDVQTMLDRVNEETREEATKVRDLEVARLDNALRAIYTRVLQGDLKAIEVMLKIQDRRAKFQGLDAPTKTETVGTNHVIIGPKPLDEALEDLDDN